MCSLLVDAQAGTHKRQSSEHTCRDCVGFHDCWFVLQEICLIARENLSYGIMANEKEWCPFVGQDFCSLDEEKVEEDFTADGEDETDIDSGTTQAATRQEKD